MYRIPILNSYVMYNFSWVERISLNTMRSKEIRKALNNNSRI